MGKKFLRSVLSRGWKKKFNGTKLHDRAKMSDFLEYAHGLYAYEEAHERSVKLGMGAK